MGQPKDVLMEIIVDLVILILIQSHFVDFIITVDMVIAVISDMRHSQHETPPNRQNHQHKQQLDLMAVPNGRN